MLFLCLCVCGVFTVLPAQEYVDDNNLSPNIIPNRYDVINNDYGTVPLTDATYVVLASKIVRPFTVYRVLVSLLRTPDNQPLEVRASLRRENVEVSHAVKVVDVGHPQLLLLQVPHTSSMGKYSLWVEGNHNGIVGGSVFRNSTELQYDPQFLSIMVQMNKPAYNGEQTVRFRAILLDTALRPHDDPVDVYILDPEGYIVRRWPSRQTNNGVVDLAFDLPVLPSVGWWGIKVSATGQDFIKKFWVERYWETRFEMSVGMPTYYLDTEESVAGSVEAWQSNDNLCYGNASLRFYARPSPKTDPGAEWILLSEDEVPDFGNEAEFEFPMSLVSAAVPTLDGAEVRVEADIFEHWMGETVTGYGMSRIITGQLYFRFLTSSPAVFKPGMPFEDYIAISYHDAQPLDEGQLESAIITVTPMFTIGTGGSTTLEDIVIEGPESGTSKISFMTPEGATEMRLKATYLDEEGEEAETELFGVAQYTLEGRNIQVYTSTDQANIGEYAILHVRTDFIIDRFTYLIMAKGLLLYTDEEIVDEMNPTIRTFTVPVSSEMAPLFHVLVYHITRDGELVTDSMSICVNSIGRHKVTLTLNDKKDHLMDTVEFKSVADYGAFFGISSVRELQFRMQIGNELSQASILNSLHSFENFTRYTHRVLHRYREGDPDHSDYYNSAGVGPDSNRTLDFLGLVAFTNTRIPQIPTVSICNASQGLLPCVIQGCYRVDQKCDKNKDCADGTDESGCDEFPDYEETVLFRLTRFSHFSDVFDAEDGDWAWYSHNIHQDGFEITTLEVPKAADNWILNAFSISKQEGIGLIDSVIEHEDTRPFYIVLEAPEAVRRGEQIGLRVICLNNMPYEMIAMLELPESDDYKFIHVEKEGVVNQYNPRTSGGAHQHLVYIPGEDVMEVMIPIVPTIEQGSFEVTVTAITQIRSDEETLEIAVNPEGIGIGEHTAVLLDLKNRAYVLQFLKIPIDESPILPDEHWRLFVFGSPTGAVSVTGDVVGPIFPETPVNKDVILGAPSRTTDDFLLDFASNLWSLHYLRLTNQWDWDQAKEVFDAMSTMYEQLMFRHSTDGGFYMFDGMPSSVWLTSHIVKHVNWADFPDWENLFYIDPKVISDGVKWILQFQTESGSFTEHPAYLRPMNPRMDPLSRIPNDPVQYRNFSLTAHVLITLHETMESLQGTVRTQAATAKIKAEKYLSRSMNIMTDPYELAITTYALILVNNIDKELAFTRLLNHARKEAGFEYWSRGEIGALPTKLEFNRPFLLPKEDFEWDSLATEATSYAILAHILMEGITVREERLVTWLTTMRKNDCGFNAGVDSLVAMQALVEFSWRARLRDITDMTVTVETSSQPDLVETLRITNESIATSQAIDLENVWGHINVVARGAGQAVLQFDGGYGIDWLPLKETPPVDAFTLSIKETYSVWRNSSLINVRICTSWIKTDEGPTSGVAVVEAEMPSGYMMVQSAADKIVSKGEHPNLMDAHAGAETMSWYFDRIGTKKECFTYQIRRWFPVANMTRFRSASIYELYQPERFEVTMFNTSTLYSLNICEVCGSYQCPYCPFYSSSAIIVPSFLVLSLMVVLPRIFSYVAS